MLPWPEARLEAGAQGVGLAGLEGLGRFEHHGRGRAVGKEAAGEVGRGAADAHGIARGGAQHRQAALAVEEQAGHVDHVGSGNAAHLAGDVVVHVVHQQAIGVEADGHVFPVVRPEAGDARGAEAGAQDLGERIAAQQQAADEVLKPGGGADVVPGLFVQEPPDIVIDAGAAVPAALVHGQRHGGDGAGDAVNAGPHGRDAARDGFVDDDAGRRRQATKRRRQLLVRDGAVATLKRRHGVHVALHAISRARAGGQPGGEHAAVMPAGVEVEDRGHRT
jgi:hypothetical protein